MTAARAADLDTDLPLLRAELPDSEVVVWDDPSVEWARFDAVFIRSTWDYHDRLDQFLAWARSVAVVTRLWNPVEVVEWNTDKRYLADLAGRQIPVVPTTFVPPGEPIPGNVTLTDDIVVKPSVGAGSNGVLRSRGDASKAIQHVERLHAAGLTAMIQPYLSQVDENGETGLVFFGGEYSHAFGKGAILDTPTDRVGGLYAEERIEPRVATTRERALAEQVIASMPETAYARIDLLPAPGGPVVLEVEVTEPSIFLHCDTNAAPRAAAVFRSLAT